MPSMDLTTAYYFSRSPTIFHPLTKIYSFKGYIDAVGLCVNMRVASLGVTEFDDRLHISEN